MKATINGINIDYRDEGAGLPVLFIHAFPLNQTMWDDQVAALKNICRAITLDLRGFGGSDVPDGPYSMDQMAADVRELMKKLGIDRAVLVGLSMGGYISLAFYRDYPEAVSAMVLADTRATLDTSEGRERRIKSAERVEREGARAIVDDMVPLALAAATVEHRPDIVERMRAMGEANSPKGIAAAQRGMAERADSTALLSSMNFPVLIIVGSEDKLTPVAEAEALRSRIPNAGFHIIEGAGHLSNLERPDEFNAALIDFIRTLKEGSRLPRRSL
ncbi:MAG TPA: alpha/beta hydrolase [Blastocatellia bacterium]|nr:alpha/beta hydrolase [Blastocatellia bacterium]